jgi:hypothetical protein
VEGGKVYRRRLWILAVLCLSVVIVQLGNLILIVALPTIQQDLGASPSAFPDRIVVEGYPP